MLDAQFSPAALVDRHRERDALDQLVAGVRAGQSRVLVLRGEAGIGKTALLEYVLAAATGCRIARAGGVESEMELAFAGLHALCTPMLGRLGQLPVPQRDALNTAFGLSSGPPPDRFLVGLAVLSLLADAVGISRSSASSTTPSGSTGCRCRHSRSWRGVSWPSGWDWCSRCVSPVTSMSSGDCRSSCSRAWPPPTPACCWTRRSPGCWTRGCGTGSSATPPVTRWRCSNCRAEAHRSTSRADSGCRCRCR